LRLTNGVDITVNRCHDEQRDSRWEASSATFDREFPMFYHEMSAIAFGEG
jgi:hypothetical protein